MRTREVGWRGAGAARRHSPPGTVGWGEAGGHTMDTLRVKQSNGCDPLKHSE